MKVSLFDFALPAELIAERPARPRDSARMLVAGQGIQDRCVSDLPALLAPGDILVFNDTRVIPARLHGRRGGVDIEILLHRQVAADAWRAFAKPGKRLRQGDTIVFAEDFAGTVEEKLATGEVLLRFSAAGDALRAKLEAHGCMPLPPYIERKRAADARDREDYQTVYARAEGSVAAPTAGLHFTPALLGALDARGVRRTNVTLHVGGGTFLPVKADDTDDHVMHAEQATVSAETADAVNRAKAAGGRVVAVGTTSLRTLESAADESGVLYPFEGETSLFITPGYRFKIVDRLLTNFHLPRSTLFMLACAFAGTERIHAAYRHAIRERYRFYSYGDACLLFRS